MRQRIVALLLALAVLGGPMEARSGHKAASRHSTTRTSAKASHSSSRVKHTAAKPARATSKAKRTTTKPKRATTKPARTATKPKRSTTKPKTTTTKVKHATATKPQRTTAKPATELVGPPEPDVVEMAPVVPLPRIALPRPLTTLPGWIVATQSLPVPLRPLPPLPRGMPFAFDENGLERVIRIDGFAPVARLLDRLPAAPVDRVLVADRFAALDRDRDGAVGRDEWPGTPSLFRRLDRNRDGFLLPGELAASDPRLAAARLLDRDRYVAFNLLDVDDDGLIAPWEWTGDMDVFFRLDSSGDGALSAAEYLGLLPASRSLPVRLALNGALDVDGDGAVERMEWVGDPYRFGRLDLDRDGKIERWEAFAGWLLRA